MKRKLCLALALAMVLSMFASLSAFAVGQFTPGVASTMYLDSWTDTNASYGFAGEADDQEIFFVDLKIENNCGFLSLQSYIHFDNDKYRLAGDGQVDYTTKNGAELLEIAAANAWVPEVGDGGVALGIADGRNKRNLMTTLGMPIRDNEYTAGFFTAGDVHYATNDGILVEYAFVAKDGVTPSLADFSLEVYKFEGRPDGTENGLPLLINENPYIPGGDVEPETKEITVTYGEGGSVEVGGVAVESPYTVEVGEDETISADIVPADGYFCSSYTLDGVVVPNTELGAIAGLTVAESLEVVFEAIPVLDPVIGQETEIDGVYYADIDNFENIGDLDYGFVLTVTRKVVNGLEIERDEEVYWCSCKGKEGANSLGQFGAIIEILNAEECDYTVAAAIRVAE